MNRFEIRFYIDSSKKSIANTIVSANSEFEAIQKFQRSHPKSIVITYIKKQEKYMKLHYSPDEIISIITYSGVNIDGERYYMNEDEFGILYFRLN